MRGCRKISGATLFAIVLAGVVSVGGSAIAAPQKIAVSEGGESLSDVTVVMVSGHSGASFGHLRYESDLDVKYLFVTPDNDWANEEVDAVSEIILDELRAGREVVVIGYSSGAAVAGSAVFRAGKAAPAFIRRMSLALVVPAVEVYASKKLQERWSEYWAHDVKSMTHSEHASWRSLIDSRFVVVNGTSDAVVRHGAAESEVLGKIQAETIRGDHLSIRKNRKGLKSTIDPLTRAAVKSSNARQAQEKGWRNARGGGAGEIMELSTLLGGCEVSHSVLVEHPTSEGVLDLWECVDRLVMTSEFRGDARDRVDDVAMSIAIEADQAFQEGRYADAMTHYSWASTIMYISSGYDNSPCESVQRDFAESYFQKAVDAWNAEVLKTERTLDRDGNDGRGALLRFCQQLAPRSSSPHEFRCFGHALPRYPEDHAGGACQ